LLADLDRVLRESGGQTVLFSQTVAARLGIHPSDLETLDILARRGPTTAGRLAELTGLSTGAITALIDRLEAKGFAHRVRDTADRRKVYVALDAERAERDIRPLYQRLAEGQAEVNSHYTDEELARIRDFLAESHALLVRETERLRGRQA
jgi:DNA-binding MarR family transcriptional regulator